MPPLRLAVFSSTTFGRRCVEEAILPAADGTLIGILTTPAEIPISYAPAPIRIATHAAFDEVAQAAGCDLRVLRGRVTTASCLEALDAWRPDLLLVLGWYFLVPRAVRERAPRGCLGIHASLLPRYRGGAPIPWAIIHGERETGVTLFHLEDEVDSGDIVGQARIPIGAHDTCADVLDRAADASVGLLRRLLPQLAAGTAPRTPQDAAAATVMPQRKPADGLIDWRWPAGRVHDFVRAQTRPYPGAFTWAGGERVTIWRAEPDAAAATGPPGRGHRRADGALVVACGSGALVVRECTARDAAGGERAWPPAEGTLTFAASPADPAAVDGGR